MADAARCLQSSQGTLSQLIWMLCGVCVCVAVCLPLLSKYWLSVPSNEAMTGHQHFPSCSLSLSENC
eukprot:6459358-Amphidinium_carterae.1